jgi:ADP-heptose:LPS heptosyltransferase
MMTIRPDDYGALSTPPRTIAVFRALQLGDLLCTVPALRALRAHAPEAQISLIGLPWASAFVSRFARYLDDFIEFPGFPGLPERPYEWRRIERFVRDMRRRRFDLMLQMHGDGAISNLIVDVLGANITGGFVGPTAYRPNDRYFIPYPDRIPEIRRHLTLMEHLGVPLRGEQLEFPVTDADGAELDGIPDASDLSERSYVCLHPGGRSPARRWALEHFAAVADRLAEEGWTVVLTGTAAERELGERLQSSVRAPVVNLMGRTGLGAVGALIRGARALITNDTGVSHIACAFRVPSVVLCTGSDPVRWGPLDRHRHRLLMGDSAMPDDALRAFRDLPPRAADASRIPAAITGASA